MTVSGHKYEQMQETSHNLQHLGIRMMHDLNARRNNVEEAYKKAIEIGLEPEHITDSMPFTPGNVKIKHKITSDINTPHLSSPNNKKKKNIFSFNDNNGQVSPHPKSPKLIKINNTFSTFTDELDECANLYKLNIEQNDIVLHASRNVIKFNERLNEQIKSKPLLLPLKISPIKRMKTLRRANTSVGRSRQQLINNNNISKPTMQKYQSLPNLRNSNNNRPNTTPLLLNKTTTNVLSPKHSTILSRRNNNNSKIGIKTPASSSLTSSTTTTHYKNDKQQQQQHPTLSTQLTWSERMAKRDLKKQIDDYTLRKRQWGKILKGELSSMNKIAKNTIDTCKRKWLTLLSIIKPIYHFEGPLMEDREERAAQRAMVEASIRMQSLFRGSFARKTHSKLTKVQELLLKRLWIVRLNLSTSKRKKAAKMVRLFCRDYASSSQFKTILKKYRWRVIFCQRTIRSFLQCKKARLKLLKKIWMKYELPIAKELQAKHVQMIKDSLRKQEEQRKTNNSLENRSRDVAIAKKKDKAMEKIFKQANDETKQKRALELMLLIRRCKGLTKVLEAKKNGDMKANLNITMINKMAKANEKNANMKLPYKLRMKYLERILKTERYKYLRRPVKKDEYQSLMMMQAKMMLDGNYNGMAEIQQAAEKTMQKPVFSFFKKMKRSHKYIQREVKKAFEELEQRKRRERRGSGGIGKSTTTTIS